MFSMSESGRVHIAAASRSRGRGIRRVGLHDAIPLRPPSTFEETDMQFWNDLQWKPEEGSDENDG